MSYEYWRAALAGEKPKAYVDDPRLGFYRKGVYQRNDKGLNKRVGWSPVAVFMVGDVMTARIGSEDTGQDVTGDQLNELWTYISDNPISEGTYREVAKLGKPWPDAHDPSKNKPSAAELMEVTAIERDPLLVSKLTEQTTEAADAKIIAEIGQARAGVSQYEKIESDEMAGRSISLKNELTTLAGKLDKVREALVRPHVDAQAEINGKYNPTIKAAKADAASLLKAAGAWEDMKREAARKAQAEADRRDRDHAEKVRLAEETGKPLPVAPKPVAPNAPPPSTQIAAAVGKKASVKVHREVTAIDLDKAFAMFRNEHAVYEVLLSLAQKATDAGLTVDGATIQEKSVVR